MLNIRTVISSLAVVAILGLTISMVRSRTETGPDASRASAGFLDHPTQAPNAGNRASVRSYRSPLDECFDVGLMGLAACRKESLSSLTSHRFPLDECFDVGLMELAACRKDSGSSAP